MGSERLPGKIMKVVKDKTILEHVVERVSQAKLIDEIIIATTTNQADDEIEALCKKLSIKLFRGNEHDVLSRYYFAAKQNNIDNIIRITSDCPLIDPFIIDEVINVYNQNSYDIVTNAGADSASRTFPRGLDTEIFSFDMLEKAYENAEKDYQKEHVTPYIYENSDKAFFYKNAIDHSNYRWTLDTPEDFDLIGKIYDLLYNGEHDFYTNDIIKLFLEKPELNKINEHIEQKKLK